ncbi:hypothetical protein DFH08DRAFT_1040966 [Mycena albidolilacea]|uniref:Uncharacterized protein n=1 Tax=Mycena albidolilacea TaxID=1033008 RepID=A0AAD6ZBI1_9AGAR|nr:hypothetical protein DFH08DRAFT_1040966 [Mycena albidolilacea]
MSGMSAAEVRNRGKHRLDKAGRADKRQSPLPIFYWPSFARTSTKESTELGRRSDTPSVDAPASTSSHWAQKYPWFFNYTGCSPCPSRRSDGFRRRVADPFRRGHEKIFNGTVTGWILAPAIVEITAVDRHLTGDGSEDVEHPESSHIPTFSMWKWPSTSLGARALDVLIARLETLRKAACGFFGAQTHHMQLFFFFALVVKEAI